jgi:hypothetical protein
MDEVVRVGDISRKTGFNFLMLGLYQFISAQVSGECGANKQGAGENIMKQNNKRLSVC